MLLLRRRSVFEGKRKKKERSGFGSLGARVKPFPPISGRWAARRQATGQDLVRRTGRADSRISSSSSFSFLFFSLSLSLYLSLSLTHCRIVAKMGSQPASGGSLLRKDGFMADLEWIYVGLFVVQNGCSVAMASTAVGGGDSLTQRFLRFFCCVILFWLLFVLDFVCLASVWG